MLGKDLRTLSEPIVGIIDRAEGRVDDEGTQSQTRRQRADPPRIAALRGAWSAGRRRIDRLSRRHHPSHWPWNAPRGGSPGCSRALAPPRLGPGSAGRVRRASGVTSRVMLLKTLDMAMSRKKSV